MRSWDKKGAGLETETLVKLILLIAFLITAVSVIAYYYEDLTVHKLKVYGCVIGNGVMSSNAAFRAAMPVPCKQDIIEEPMGIEELSIYLPDVWLMYGKGDWDYHTRGDSHILVSALQLKKDIEIKDLMQYLLTHKGKKDLAEDNVVTDEELKVSDYNYLQEGSKGQTLCFQEDLLKEGKLSMQKIYYILFWDDQGKDDAGDKIVITTSSSISKKSAVACCSLKQGICTKLDGEKWYELPSSLSNWVKGLDWRWPSEPQESYGKMV
ncbi:MAG: hypothetical protein U9Q69_06370 [Nanoarchaeota archaeon]|nr:hypothetical protein [Nanoarchaeota archaeon]